MEISALDNLIFSRVLFLLYNIIANCDAPLVVYWSSSLLSSAETWFLSWHLPSIWNSLAIKYKTSLARRWALNGDERRKQMNFEFLNLGFDGFKKLSFSWHQTTKPRILFSLNFSTNFSQFDQMKKKTNFSLVHN